MVAANEPPPKTPDVTLWAAFGMEVGASPRAGGGNFQNLLCITPNLHYFMGTIRYGFTEKTPQGKN
jgi:hypothetical protein